MTSRGSSWPAHFGARAHGHGCNCYGAGGGVELPFGGTKKSGHGREKGFIALEHMSTTKTVVNHHG